MRIRLLSGAAFAAALLTSGTAAADSMDPALGRLVLDESCRSPRADGQGEFYEPSSGFVRCSPHHTAFAKLVSQLGFAFAPVASHPARTTGFGGYRVSLEGSYTTIDDTAPYWSQATEGPKAADKNQFSINNPSPDGVLQVYSLKLAKGFPFGVELGASFGYMVNTTMVAGGGDVRIALFEGFRENIPGYFPDVAVGGGVRTMAGTSEIKLTIASFDTQLSKPIPIAGTVSLHPHVGYQWLRIFGDSGLVDLTPNTNPLSLCGYAGDNNPATPQAGEPFDGQPVCNGGSSADFNNTVVFNRVRLTRHRINFGTQLRYQMLHFGVHVITDLMSAADANPDEVIVQDVREDPNKATTIAVNNFGDDPRTPENDEVSKQWTVAIELGALF